MVRTDVLHDSCSVEALKQEFRSLSYSSQTLGFAFICLLCISPSMCKPCKDVAQLKAT